jgi:hypothetical protein
MGCAFEVCVSSLLVSAYFVCLHGPFVSPVPPSGGRNGNHVLAARLITWLHTCNICPCCLRLPSLSAPGWLAPERGGMR